MARYDKPKGDPFGNPVIVKGKHSYKPIPIKAAKIIAEAYDKDIIIILTYDKEHKLEHVTTYGRTAEDCDNAAEGGNRLKRALGWDESLCNATPNRVKKKVDEAYAKGKEDGIRAVIGAHK